MRSDEASLTARGVALVRSRLERPPWPSGDPDADDRLTATLTAGFTPEPEPRVQRRDEFFGFMKARTRFFDAAVIGAIEEDVHQIVILGAGYDGRALRYRTPGVQFFEVDHPATQADKRRRLAEVGASLDGITFVTADFTEPGLADALATAGHDAQQRSLFICEGVLRYLPEDAFRGLLRTAAERAVPASDPEIRHRVPLRRSWMSTRCAPALRGIAVSNLMAMPAALMSRMEPFMRVPSMLTLNVARRGSAHRART